MFVDFDVRRVAQDQDVERYHVSSRSLLQPALKRSLDIVISLSALLCLLPLLLVVAAVIKLQSSGERGGAVFFRQIRNGKAETKFEILKFRSMKHESGVKFRQCTQADARVTSFGKFLRKSSIDELPQLINVLRGDMSIVGPRPHPIELDEKYAGIIPRYMDRYAAKPGLTGLAQIQGFRGPTPDVETMARRVYADLNYAERVTVGRDFSIMLRTIPAVLFPENAH